MRKKKQVWGAKLLQAKVTFPHWSLRAPLWEVVQHALQPLWSTLPIQWLKPPGRVASPLQRRLPRASAKLLGVKLKVAACGHDQLASSEAICNES